MTKVSMIGLDLGKNALQVHGIDARGNVVLRKQLRRGQIACMMPAAYVMIHASATSAKLFRINKRELKTSKKIPNGI